VPTDAAGLAPARVTRLLVAGWAFHLKSLSLSTFFILTSAIQPVIFASIAFYMFRAGGHAPTLLYSPSERG
jgi:ABC-2 type transport system permease protein